MPQPAPKGRNHVKVVNNCKKVRISYTTDPRKWFSTYERWNCIDFEEDSLRIAAENLLDG